MLMQLECGRSNSRTSCRSRAATPGRSYVQDAILVHSSMYLPARPVIRDSTSLRTARPAGARSCPLLIHGRIGKSSGMLWRDLARRGMQCSHLGDVDERSRRTSGQRARGRACVARLSIKASSLPTAFEQCALRRGWAPGSGRRAVDRCVAASPAPVRPGSCAPNSRTGRPVRGLQTEAQRPVPARRSAAPRSCCTAPAHLADPAAGSSGSVRTCAPTAGTSQSGLRGRAATTSEAPTARHRLAASMVHLAASPSRTGGSPSYLA